jgi:hypothetical protein
MEVSQLIYYREQLDSCLLNLNFYIVPTARCILYIGWFSFIFFLYNGFPLNALLPWHLIDKKIYIKVKAKSQSENKNTVIDFELINGNTNQPLNSTADQSKWYFLSNSIWWVFILLSLFLNCFLEHSICIYL